MDKIEEKASYNLHLWQRPDGCRQGFGSADPVGFVTFCRIPHPKNHEYESWIRSSFCILIIYKYVQYIWISKINFPSTRLQY